MVLNSGPDIAWFLRAVVNHEKMECTTPEEVGAVMKLRGAMEKAGITHGAVK